jgi:hypothetical protein
MSNEITQKPIKRINISKMYCRDIAKLLYLGLGLPMTPYGTNGKITTFKGTIEERNAP